jgi:hypothetical protein
MKFITLCLALFLGLAVSGLAAEKGAKKSAGKLYHAVSVKFKDTTTPEQIRQVEQAFADLKNKIKVIKSLAWGTNVSPENLNKGFTHCWVLTFKNEADRDLYLKHPDHQAFGKSLGPVLADVMVIDFKAQPYSISLSR